MKHELLYYIMKGTTVSVSPAKIAGWQLGIFKQGQYTLDGLRMAVNSKREGKHYIARMQHTTKLSPTNP